MDGSNWLVGRAEIDAYDDIRLEIEEFDVVCAEWWHVHEIHNKAEASVARDLKARLDDIIRRFKEMRRSEIDAINIRYDGQVETIETTSLRLSQLMLKWLQAQESDTARRIESNGDARALVVKTRKVPVLSEFMVAAMRYAAEPDLVALLEKLARTEMRRTKAKDIPGFRFETRESIG